MIPATHEKVHDSGPEWKPEPRRALLARHRHRAHLYVWAFALVALLVILIALVVPNTRSVKLDWVFGSTKASLIWIIVAAAIFGWVAGLVTGILFRHHTRRRVELE